MPRPRPQGLDTSGQPHMLNANAKASRLRPRGQGLAFRPVPRGLGLAASHSHIWLAAYVRRLRPRYDSHVLSSWSLSCLASRQSLKFANVYLLVRSSQTLGTTHSLTVRATPDFQVLSRPRRLLTSTASLLMPSVQPISTRIAFGDFACGICTHRLGTLVLRSHSSDPQPHLE